MNAPVTTSPITSKPPLHPPSVGRQRLLAAIPAVVILLVIPLGLVLSSYTRFILSLCVVGALVGIGLVPLMGLARIVSLASAGFVAVGAYATGVLMERFALPYVVAGFVAVVFGSALGVLLGAPAARFRGHYLTLVTLVFQIVVVVGLREWDSVTGGPRGLRFPSVTPLLGLDTETMVFILSLVTLAVFVTLGHLLATGDFGKSLVTVANAEVAAEAFAIRPERYRMLAFTLSAFTASTAGVFLAPLLRVFDPTAFDLFLSVTHISYVVVGGVTSIWGAALGAGLLTALPEVLRPLAEYQEVIFAALLLLAVLLVPDGIAGRLAALIGRGRSTWQGRPATAHSTDTAPGPSDGANARIGPATWDGPQTEATAERSAGADVTVRAPRTGSAEPVLRCRGVSRSFAGLRAVHRVDVDIARNEVRGLIGPNGAGKTTLVNLISGVERTDEGRIEMAGRDVTVLRPAAHAELGMSRTFQNVQLVPHLSARDNVRAGTLTFRPTATLARSVTMSSSDPSVDEDVASMLAALRLTEVADHPAGSLSLGAQRRVEIGRALVSQPTLVLLDEPAAGLTGQERQDLAALLRYFVASRGVSLLLIDHDIDFVTGLADVVTALVHGEVIAEGSPGDVLADPALRRAYFGT